MTDNGLLAVLEQVTECRRCGTPTAPHPTGELLCGPCWRHIPLWEERVAQQASHAGRQEARKRARTKGQTNGRTTTQPAGSPG